MMNINDFPDEILTHILSFLPFKQAFRTTVLSKRWRPLPRSLAVLHIDDNGVKDTTDWFLFRQFMDTVIFSPNSHHPPLSSFHLTCCFADRLSDSSIFDQWIQAAKQRHVKLIDLFFVSMVPMAPSTIFCCKTLVHLQLMNVSVAKMPLCPVDLPLLKYLNLSHVRFNDMEDLMILIYRCPMLLILRTSFVKTSNGVTVGGYLKPISNLIIAEIYLFDVPLTIFSNVQHLTILEMGKVLQNEEINSYYKDFPVFGNLINLKISWLFRGIHDWDVAVKILQNCPKLQTLLILKGFDLTTKENWKYPSHVPECISSHLTSCHISNYEASEADFLFATYILQNAKLLKVMTIRQTYRPKPFESSQYLEDLSSSQSISPALKLEVYNSSRQRIYPLI